MATKRHDDDGDEAQTVDRTVDPDSMSAPDQADYQRLTSARTEAQARGDTQAVADLDAQLAALQKRQ